MSKKPKAAPAPVVHELPDELHDEITLLGSTAPKVVWQEGEEIEVKEDAIDAAVSVLALVRSAINRLDEQSRALVAKTVPEDIAKKLDTIDKERKALKKQAEQAEDLVKRGLMAALALGTLTPEGYTAKSGAKLSVVGKVDVEITDLDSLPDEFLIRTPDYKGLKDALETYERKRAAVAELDLPEPEPTVHGARLTTKYHFTTRLPDVIED